MSNKNFIIEKPCNKNWENMSPNDQGRHCKSCNKTVVDFSTWETEAIQAYFKATNERVCGRFRVDQVQTNRSKLQQKLIKAHQHIQLNFKIPIVKSIILVLLSACLFISSCNSSYEKGEVNQPERQLMGDTIHIDSSSAATPIDSLKTEETIIGEPKR